MRIVRPEMHWWVISPKWSGGEMCLEEVALRCGYRIGEICEKLECSERYLYEVFARDVGLSPKEWMRRERMVMACRMLAGGKSVEEASARLGFGSVKYFLMEYRKFYQISPSEYQQRCRGVLGNSAGFRS